MDQHLATSLAIGIEIGGTKTQVGIGSAKDGLLPVGITRRQVVRERGAEGIRRDVIAMVAELLQAKKLTISQIDRVGIGYGGILDSARGVTLRSFQIEGWTDFPLKAWAESQWRKPVLIENDASVAGLAESMLGNGRGYGRVFYITIGSGVGGGWIVDQNVDGGQGLGAAEIGHMWVPDPLTGEFKELEQVCSGWSIGQRAREAASQSHSLMQTIAGSIQSIDAKVLYSACEAGDPLALQILDETCRILGMTVSNIVALLHPERVIVGGGVSLMGPLFWDRLQQQFRSRVLPTFASTVELVPAQLREDVVVIGALCLGQSGHKTL